MKIACSEALWCRLATCGPIGNPSIRARARTVCRTATNGSGQLACFRECRRSGRLRAGSVNINTVERFWVKNFGCRASQADGAAIEAGLAAKGFSSATSAADAGLIVLNTCTVTAAADDEVRQAVRRIHRDHPQARILVTGCYAQRAPQELASIDGVTLVVGNSHKTQIPDFVSGGMDYHGQIEVGDIFASHDFLSAPVEDAAGERTRPNLKIQDG